MITINVWDVIAQDEKVAKGFNEREKTVLQNVNSFRLRSFRGSGLWEIKDAFTYSQALYNQIKLPRALIYAVSEQRGEKWTSTIPWLDEPDRQAELVWRLRHVGVRKLSKELVDLELRVIHETKMEEKNEGAVLVTNLKGANVWLPKSMIELEEADGQNMWLITMPQWLAESKQLV